jgi:hypothetical protein
MNLLFLVADGADNFLYNVGEKLTLVAALAYFLYYFMKELRSVREQQEKARIEYEAKQERMFDRVSAVEAASREQALLTNKAMERLSDAIEDLSDNLKKT